MPAELKLQGKRKQTTKAPIMAKRSKKSKEFDDKKLEILEQKETNMKDPEGSEKGENDSDDGEVNVVSKYTRSFALKLNFLIYL